jgi:hypothetical protein
MEKFLKLVTTGERALHVDMDTLRDQERAYLSQAGTSRIFIPRPFVASPSYNALGTP